MNALAISTFPHAEKEKQTAILNDLIAMIPDSKKGLSEGTFDKAGIARLKGAFNNAKIGQPFQS